jgi:hypothetical protein
MNYGSTVVVVIPRCAGDEHGFVAVTSEKSVLNGPSMDSLISRMGLRMLYSIGFAVMAADR